MIKCKEYLAFVNAKTNEIKYRFEIEFTEKELRIEGRRPQLIKKILGQALKEKWINGRCLFGYLKKSRGVTGKDILSWVFGPNPTHPEKEDDD